MNGTLKGINTATKLVRVTSNWLMKLGKVGILVVEDEPNDVFFLRYAFEQAGIAAPTYFVSDGEQAVDYLAGTGTFADRETHPLPNLVLLDLKLPRKSGLEVLHWVRTQPALRNIIVIVFTSSSDPLDVEQCYQLGANSCIEKPLDLHQRVEIARLLNDWWLRWNVYGALPGEDAALPEAAIADVHEVKSHGN